MFDRAAKIATAILGREIDDHEVAMICLCVKLAREMVGRPNVDNAIDGCAYLDIYAHLKHDQVTEGKPDAALR